MGMGYFPLEEGVGLRVKDQLVQHVVVLEHVIGDVVQPILRVDAHGAQSLPHATEGEIGAGDHAAAAELRLCPLRYVELYVQGAAKLPQSVPV